MGQGRRGDDLKEGYPEGVFVSISLQHHLLLCIVDRTRACCRGSQDQGGEGGCRGDAAQDRAGEEGRDRPSKDTIHVQGKHPFSLHIPPIELLFADIYTLLRPATRTGDVRPRLPLDGSVTEDQPPSPSDTRAHADADAPMEPPRDRPQRGAQLQRCRRPHLEPGRETIAPAEGGRAPSEPARLRERVRLAAALVPVGAGAGEAARGGGGGGAELLRADSALAVAAILDADPYVPVAPEPAE